MTIKQRIIITTIVSSIMGAIGGFIGLYFFTAPFYFGFFFGFTLTGLTGMFLLAAFIEEEHAKKHERVQPTSSSTSRKG